MYFHFTKVKVTIYFFGEKKNMSEIHSIMGSICECMVMDASMIIMNDTY
jgi:hypothetical protein